MRTADDLRRWREGEVDRAKREVNRSKLGVEKTSAARYALPAGSSRARVTTANARWMRKCEAHDRALRQLAEAEAALRALEAVNRG